jgi:2-hydroxy-3-keto-5-methylthiopentenyl-1-phosphate phosphatase
MSRSVVIDFDGTVTEHDLLDTIARDFGDPAVYKEVEDGLDAGTMPLREVITREFAPVTAPLEEVVGWVLEHARVRAGFRDFVERAQSAGWDVHVVSSGFHELIEPVLEREAARLEVLANHVDARPDGWVVRFRDEAACATCGEPCKRGSLAGEPYVYVGDGYSDRCAALAAERIFARDALATYLDERGIGYEPFEDLRDVLAALAT